MDSLSYSKHISATEQKLLAALLSGSLPITDIETVGNDLFSVNTHNTIFKIIINYGKIDSQGIDTVLFFQLALQLGLDQKVGGSDYIDELLALPFTKNAEHDYMAILAEAATKRKLTALLGEMQIELTHPKSNSEEISNKLMESVIEINNLYKYKTFESIQLEVDSVISKALFKMKQDVPNSELRFGFDDLDDITGGLALGEVTVIAGRPGMGKTAFALELLLNVGTKQKKAAAYVSLEMYTASVLKRMLTSLSGIAYHRIDRGEMTEDEAKTLVLSSEKLNDAKIFILEQHGKSVFEIEKVIRKLKQQENIELLIMDDIQMLNVYPHNNYRSREQEVSKISNLLKQYALKLNISIVLLSQLSRATESRGGTRRPMLSDLRDSGAIEQDAAKVLFLYRAEYYGLMVDEDNEPTKGAAEIIVAKNRSGRIGTAKLRFKANIAKFEDYEITDDSFDKYSSKNNPERSLKAGNNIFGQIKPKNKNEDDVPW